MCDIDVRSAHDEFAHDEFAHDEFAHCEFTIILKLVDLWELPTLAWHINFWWWDFRTTGQLW